MQWSTDQTRYSMASVEGDFSGLQLRGIQDLGLTDELTKDPIYGNSSVSIGVPVGMHKAEGALTLIPEEYDSLVFGLGDQFGTTPGTIGITLFEPNGAGVYTINASRVYLIKVEAKFGKPGGQDPATKALGLLILDPIDWGGLSIVRDQNSGALSLGGIIGGALNLLNF
jgi:hypothetical protein